jgi:PTS system nitrogen regulatory IIA component
MELKELLAPDQVISRLRATDKAQMLKELARRAAGDGGVEPRPIQEALAAREKLGSTGVGQGIAIPHARIEGLRRPIALFARLEQPIEFAAIDERKVDLVMLLLSPGGGEHLPALACISRRLREPGVADRLRATENAAELYRILAGA